MTLTVKFYDVEHGSCTHIITPNNKHFLVDIGTKGTKSICQHLKNTYFKGQGCIDYLVITHPHIDHIADLGNLYQHNIQPRVLFRPKAAFPLQIVPSDTTAQISLKQLANTMNNTFNSTVSKTEDPTSYHNNGGVLIHLFTPYVDDTEKSDLNNFSCVMTLEYAGFKVVLTGDNPSAKLDELLKNPQFCQAIKDATVLLAPHHGRDSDFCEDFVELVNPRITVFSDKPIQHETQTYAAQRYYHKTRGVIWNDTPRSVFTTRKDGTIIFKFNADKTWSINTTTTEY